MKYFPKIFLPLLASAVPAMGSAPDGLVEGVKIWPAINLNGAFATKTKADAARQHSNVRGGLSSQLPASLHENRTTEPNRRHGRNLAQETPPTCSINDPSLNLTMLPTIDGTISHGEYLGWHNESMYEGGRNTVEKTGDNPALRIRGVAHFGYFCPLKLFCVAAYSTNGETIDQDDSSYVWIDEVQTGNVPKNFVTGAQTYAWVTCDNGTPDVPSDDFVCGWEACWVEEVADLNEKSIQVHYNKEENDGTRSTGKPNNGLLLCMKLDCLPIEYCTADGSNGVDCSEANTECAEYDCESGLCVLKSAQNNAVSCLDDTGCCDGNGNCNIDSTTCSIPEGCGNGKVEAGEECDDGNNIDNDGCDNDCKLPVCGDGKKGGDEECDDGKDANGSESSTCDAYCKLKPYCGDGIVDLGEECDDGKDNNSDEPNASCRTGCTLPGCGDGIVDDKKEDCDSGDANSDAPNAPCRANCTEPKCGDGIVDDEKEECDEGPGNGKGACLPSCKLSCGDGIVNGNDQCDPPNGSTCDNFCMTIMPKCGDGKIDPGEQCDFGDTTSGDGCSANCQIEPCHEKNAGDLCDTGNDGIMDACCIEAGSAGTCWRSQSWSPFDANNDKVFDYCCPCAASFGSPPIFKVGGSVANSELVQTVECTGSPPPYPQDLKAFDCQGNGLTSSIKLVTDPTPTGIDVCDNDVDYERVWSVSSCGQTSFFTQNITVKDTTKPAVPDLTPREYSCFANVPVATKDVVTTKDTCAGEITGVHKSDTFPQNCGFTRVWTFADNCGNSVEGSVAIQIIDKEAPVVTKPSDASFQCLGDVPPVDDKSASATDNCGEVSMVGSASESFALTSSGGCLDRVITRQWTFKDPCDNQGTGTQLVTVKDTTPPAPPTPPKNETFACAADLDSQQVPNPGDAQDTCYGPIQPTYSSTRTDGSCRNKFTQNRTWTYTDKCGNSASISQQVVVNDDKPPVLPEGTVPKDVNIQCAAAFPPAQPLTALDNCDGSINIFPVDTTTPGSCANEFTTKRTWTFEDVCKNDLSETQTIEVNDDEAPQFISFPEDKSLTCQDPCASNLLLSSECTGTPTSTDNCDGTIIPTKVDVSEDLATGTGVTITRTWTATDVCGNPNSKDQTIVVEDACRFTVSDAFSGKSVNVLVNVINVEGGVEISVSVPKDVAGECTGDIRGVFFEVAGGADRLDDIVISGDHVTSKKIGEGEIDRVANDVLMKGGGQNANKFDVGVEIGTQGISKDDICETSFVVSGLTTTDFIDVKFGIRLTSVADDNGGRGESSKVTAISDCCRFELPPPPPPPVCGNEKKEGSEQCDAGEDNSDTEPNACRTDCTLPSCGDGVVDSNEECEPPNTETCDESCKEIDNCVETCIETCEASGLVSEFVI